jgi:hypothetical protein
MFPLGAKLHKVHLVWMYKFCIEYDTLSQVVGAQETFSLYNELTMMIQEGRHGPRSLC